MTNFLNKIVKRARRNLGRPQAPLPQSWRKVESGPLAGFQFYLPSGEGAGWADRFLCGQYEPEMLAALAGLARDGGTLYDIGAHMGFYTCAWLRLGGSHVEAFEPVPYNRELLQATLQRNSLSGQVRIHPVALGDKESQATMVASNADVGAASAAYIPELGAPELPSAAREVQLPGLSRITVPVHRLDNLRTKLNLANPSALKLDVEGAEAAVLAGSTRLLEETHPAVLCEVHNTEAGLEIAHRLSRLHYELHILGKNGAYPACLWVKE